MLRAITVACITAVCSAQFVLGGLGQGLLLCLHDDLSVHLKDSEAEKDHCGDAVDHLLANCHQKSCSDCVDVDLGSEEILSTLNNRFIPIAQPSAHILPWQSPKTPLAWGIRTSGPVNLRGPPCPGSPLESIQRTVLLRL